MNLKKTAINLAISLTLFSLATLQVNATTIYTTQQGVQYVLVNPYATTNTTTTTTVKPATTTQPATAAPITIIRYGTTTCPYCQKEDKTLNQMKAEYGSSLNVQFVNINEPANKAYINKYNIKGIPFVTILNNKNQQVDSFVGYHDESQITSLLKKDGLLK